METKTILIRYYILTHIDFDGWRIERTDSYKGMLSELMHVFSEYSKERRKLGYRTSEIFGIFCGSLPSCFRVDFETYKQRELLKKWRVPVSGYSDSEIADLFYNTIYETLIEWGKTEWRTGMEI